MATALLVGLLAAGAATAAPVEKDGTWIEVKGPEFVAFTDGGARAARRVISRFEKIHAALAAVLPAVKLSGDEGLYVIGARSEKSLRSLVPEFWERKNGVRPSAVHLQGYGQVFLLVRTDLREDDDQGFHAAYWGYAAHVIALNMPGLPLWARRGFSDFYSLTTIRKEQILIGRASPSHVKLLRRRGLMPTSELFAVDRQSPEYLDWSRRERFDAECWALVHYLMLGDKGAHRPLLARYLTLLGPNKQPDEAAREAFGDLGALDEALAGYIRSQAFYVHTIDASVARKFETSPERPLSSAEALTMRAAVHLASDRRDDSRACLDEALRLDPKLAWAHEVRADLAWAEDDPVTAREEVAQALALAPGDEAALRLQKRVTGPPTVKGAARLCDAGDLEACDDLGGWLIDGSGANADPVRGVAVLEKACNGGRAESCTTLSWRFRQGTGVSADPVRAVAFLEKACEAGDGKACLAAAANHESGEGVPKDPAAAARMLESACTRGESSGCLALAWALQNGEGVPRDLERAAALYQDACHGGDAPSCSRLGLLYVIEDGLPRDPEKAKELLQKACDLGDQVGCSNLKAVEQMTQKKKARRR